MKYTLDNDELRRAAVAYVRQRCDVGIHTAQAIVATTWRIHVEDDQTKCGVTSLTLEFEAAPDPEPATTEPPVPPSVVERDTSISRRDRMWVVATFALLLTGTVAGSPWVMTASAPAWLGAGVVATLALGFGAMVRTMAPMMMRRRPDDAR